MFLASDDRLYIIQIKIVYIIYKHFSAESGYE